jgi:hypothetical protein
MKQRTRRRPPQGQGRTSGRRHAVNFVGNIEGLDIPRGVADVVVCSGYVGNVVIKMLEGVSDTVVSLARYAYKEKLLWRAQQVLFVAREMLESPEHEIPTLANSLQDILRRGRMPRAVALELATEIQQAAAGAADPDARRIAEGIAAAFTDRVRQLGGAPPLEHPDHSPKLDYVALVDAEYQHRRGGKRRRRNM